MEAETVRERRIAKNDRGKVSEKVAECGKLETD